MGNLYNYSTDVSDNSLGNWDIKTKNYDSDYSLLNSEKGLDIENQKSTKLGEIKSIEMGYDDDKDVVYTKITLSNGNTIYKEYDITEYLLSAYNNGYNQGKQDGINSVDFDKVETKLIGNNVQFVATLTNGKSKMVDYQLSEDEIRELYMALSDRQYCGLWIKIGNTEHLFPVESREYQPTPNVAYQKAIDGTPEFIVLGQPENRWSFELYVDCLDKLMFLQKLVSNPTCQVKFDEVGDYVDALVTSFSYTRITTGNYNASLELVIL